MKSFVGPGDLVAFDPERDLSFPGEFPFTRGIQPTMYRGRLWTMRQYAGFATAAATNERFRYLLQRGQTGLSTAFDLPTQLGLDSDDERSLGEVGRTGVALDTLDDMEAARGLYASLGFEEIPPYYFNPVPGAHYLKATIGAATSPY